MAEAVLFNIAESLLQQLSSPLKDELFLLWASKSELKKLHNTISTIKDVLQDAEKQQATDAAVKTWLQRLRCEMYKADDLFDEISTRALQKKVMSGNKIAREVRLFFSKSNHLALLVSTAHKVKELRGNIDDISNDIHKFDFLRSKIEAPRPIVGRHEEHSYVNRDEIIGRDKEKESIVNALKADADGGAPVVVISVIGFGGSGKTGLAQLVYNELKQVPGQFDLYLWACVNSFSNLNLALEKIVACGTKEKFKDYQLEQLQEMLREKIAGRKYLLVLDDVWEENVGNWDRLKRLLDVGNVGSKVLVTARSEVVAKTLSAAKPYHQLEGLSDEDAWSLFKKFAFYPNELEKIQRMEKAGKDIVRRCKNVPLALRSMGSLLRDKDESSWLNAPKDEICGDVMEVLKVSYDDLPSSLKHCFAYCALFPKDYRFEKDKLIRLWMAQGFLEVSSKEKSLEEVGEESFNSLLQRCFFQDVERFDDQIVACKMHDLLHDLAIKVAGRECCMVENFTDNFNEPLLHVSLDFKADFPTPIPPSLLKMKGLRTLISQTFIWVNERLFVRQMFAFKSLRVLDLKYLRMEELPSSIGELVHLRYLDLSGNEVLINLPDSICKLQNLQTLDVTGCRRLKKFPDDLKLLCLRELFNFRCEGLTCMPSGLSQMISLVSLNLLVVNSASGGLRVLRDLNHLRECLDIKLPGSGWKNSVEDAKESMLGNKTGLHTLYIEWGDGEDAENMLNSDEVLDHLQPCPKIREFGLVRFPGTRMSLWINSLMNLQYLSIEHCHRCLQLPPLWRLQRLTDLWVCDLPLVEYMQREIRLDTNSFFPSLTRLCIRNMPKLKGWSPATNVVRVSPENVATEQSQLLTPLPWFPLLSDVQIWKCQEFTHMPLFPCVKKLSLKEVNEKLLRQSVLRAPECFESDSSCVGVGSSISTPPLSSSARQPWCRPESLEISDMEDLISLPEEWTPHFSALRILDITNCPKLKSFPRGILQSLKHIKELDISNFRELKLWNEEDQDVDEMTLISLGQFKGLTVGLHQLKGLEHLIALEELCIIAGDADAAITPWIPPPNLCRLKIRDANQPSHFDGVFHHLSKLSCLQFDRCDIEFMSAVPWEVLVGLQVLILWFVKGMKGLPESCQYLSNLLDLSISWCDDIECLPDWITRLQRLHINECPQLEKKFHEPSDPLRTQIQRIPNVMFGLRRVC